jgi:hypothetical protein
LGVLLQDIANNEEELVNAEREGHLVCVWSCSLSPGAGGIRFLGRDGGVSVTLPVFRSNWFLLNEG